MTGSDIVLTAHAEDMLAERNIERAWIESTIRNPQALESDPTQPDAFRAFRAIAERDGRTLRVVYVQDQNTIRVLTAFFDRGRR